MASPCASRSRRTPSSHAVASSIPSSWRRPCRPRESTSPWWRCPRTAAGSSARWTCRCTWSTRRVAPTLEERVFDSIAALTTALGEIGDRFDIVHSQDCISARAAARVRDAGTPYRVIRTVHHVDDFTTQALIDCQRNAILEPDDVLVVSRGWQQQLLDDYGVKADIVTNGVRTDRFGAGDHRATPARNSATVSVPVTGSSTSPWAASSPARAPPI